MTTTTPRSVLDALRTQTLTTALRPARRTRLQRPFPSQPRAFTTTPPLHSNVGRSPVSIPPGCDIEVNMPTQTPAQARAARKAAPVPKLRVTGPLGQLQMEIPAYAHVEWDKATRKAVVSVSDDGVKLQKAMWGTVRSYLQNHVLGVTEGHSCILRLVGVGYRATVEKSAVTVSPSFEGQEFVNLKVGYSHPIELPVPAGVKASTPQPTRILLEGIEKEVVKQFAATIRRWRVPEPYKGKGIFVDDETIRLKAKKIK